MTRVQKAVLWTLALCAVGYLAIHLLVVEAPWPAHGQVQGDGGETRTMAALCLDRGQPVAGVIVDIFRQTGGPVTPRVESFGRTTTDDAGRLQVSLPWNTDAQRKAAAGQYLLYFTAPGRAIKSLLVNADNPLPEEVLLPPTSEENVYVPPSHLVMATDKGIVMGKGISGAEGFSDRRGGANNSLSGPPPSSFAAAHDPTANGFPTAPVPEAPTVSHRVLPAQTVAQSYTDRIEAAVKTLREASSEGEKDAARQTLRTLLTEVFAADMQSRSRQAQEIENRLAKLREQYQAREQVKDEIISLQLQVLEKQAAGLGFPAIASEPADAPAERIGIERKPLVLNQYVLSEFKRRNAAAILEMNKHGLFVESLDGKLYAYANVNFPNGPSNIVVRDSNTGEVVGAGNTVDAIGPLEFAEDGVATRNRNDELQLRIRLPATKGRPDGPNAFAPNSSMLDDLAKRHPTVILEMKRHGHFIESADGKLYAFANVNSPKGPSNIRVVDAATGKLVTEANVAQAVGPLEFTDEGVATRGEDGALQLIVPLSTRPNPTSDVQSPHTLSPAPVDPLGEAKAEAARKEQDRTPESQIAELELQPTGGRYRTGISKEKALDIAGYEGVVRVLPGQRRLERLPKATTKLQWRWGDVTEGVDEPELFDYVLIEWLDELSFTFYRSPDLKSKER